MALGLIGQLKAQPASSDAASTTYLSAANTTGGVALMQALAQRHSQREFDPAPLPLQMLSDLLRADVSPVTRILSTPRHLTWCLWPTMRA